MPQKTGAQKKFNSLYAELCRDYRGGLSNTSTAKFDEMREYLAELTGLTKDDVYIVAASKRPTNLEVRFTQGIRATKHTELGIGFLSAASKEQLDSLSDSALVTARKFLGRNKANYTAIGILGIVGDEVHFSRLLDTSGGKMAEKIKEHFPDVVVQVDELPPASEGRPAEASMVPATIAAITSPKPLSAAKTVRALKGMVPAMARDFAAAGLRIEEEFLTRLLAALKTKRFAIMTGLSGSGKTKVAQAMARWLSEDAETALVVPVAADWTSSEDLIGFPDALDKTRYVSTATTALLVSAATRPEVPHFLILDEMNLSHVERYFADFLSAMESEEPLKFYEPDGGARSSVPAGLARLPDNLFVIGTVNVDESTYMFSPKVLDRANVFEFRTSLDGLSSFLAKPGAVKLDGLAGKGSKFAEAFLAGTVGELEAALDKRRNAELTLVHDLLGRHGAEFGFRTAFDVCKFIRWHKLFWGEGWSIEKSFDAQVVQKVLPKLHGSSKTLTPILHALWTLCVRGRSWGGDGKIENRDQIVKDALGEAGEVQVAKGDSPYYPISYGKIERMMRRLDADGFASFAEA